MSMITSQRLGGRSLEVAQDKRRGVGGWLEGGHSGGAIVNVIGRSQQTVTCRQETELHTQPNDFRNSM